LRESFRDGQPRPAISASNISMFVVFHGAGHLCLTESYLAVFTKTASSEVVLLLDAVSRLETLDWSD